jgi:hypothetical protein
MCIEELRLEVVQRCVVELELPLEGAVGDTAMPLEHGHRVVENLLKGHRPPPMSMRRVEDGVGIGQAVRAHLYRT